MTAHSQEICSISEVCFYNRFIGLKGHFDATCFSALWEPFLPSVALWVLGVQGHRWLSRDALGDSLLQIYICIYIYIVLCNPGLRGDLELIIQLLDKIHFGPSLPRLGNHVADRACSEHTGECSEIEI